MDLTGFEMFTGPSRARIAAPLISLQSRGGFSLNGPAFEAMGRPETVVLLFNATAQKIALKAVPEGTPHAVRVRSAGKGQTHVISALSFLRANGVEFEGTASRALPTKIDSGVAVIELIETGDGSTE